MLRAPVHENQCLSMDPGMVDVAPDFKVSDPAACVNLHPLRGHARYHVNSSSIGVDASEEPLCLFSATEIVLAVFVKGRLGIGIAAPPEVVDETVSLAISLEEEKDVHFFRSDDRLNQCEERPVRFGKRGDAVFPLSPRELLWFGGKQRRKFKRQKGEYGTYCDERASHGALRVVTPDGL